MTKEKCAIGLPCAVMLMQPGLAPENCPNYSTCKDLQHSDSDETAELIRAKIEHGERIYENIGISQSQAAGLMLMLRGCPQTPESLGVIQALASVESHLFQLRQQLVQYNDKYIAPTECEVHRYKVRGVYEYNKLTAATNIFEPSEKESKTRVIHLGDDQNSRNLEARAGIARRNKMLALANQLRKIEQMLTIVLAEL